MWCVRRYRGISESGPYSGTADMASVFADKLRDRVDYIYRGGFGDTGGQRYCRIDNMLIADDTGCNGSAQDFALAAQSWAELSLRI